ncbi:hypothetical protein [Prosthecobacter fusiformis]|nr:hypothetical protein [Prosthecobacter fusiformis]
MPSKSAEVIDSSQANVRQLSSAGQASVTFLVEMPENMAVGETGERRGFAKPQYDVSTSAARKAAEEVTYASARLFPKPADQDDRNWTKANAADRDRGLLARAVASSKVDDMLGLNCVAQEGYTRNAQGQLMGLSVEVDGAQVLTKVTPQGGGADVLCALNVDYRDPRIQKGLSDLEVTDYITGQIDRHEGNIVINPDTGKVMGIDNDLAFPRADRADVYAGWGEVKCNAVGTLPQQIHMDTAKKVLAMNPQEMERMLRTLPVPQGCNALTQEEVNGACQRLQELQAAIRNPAAAGIEIVTEFNQQTYDAAIDKQQKAIVAAQQWSEGVTIPPIGTAANGERSDWEVKLSKEDMGAITNDLRQYTPKTSYLGGAVKFQATAEMGSISQPDLYGVRQPETATQAVRSPAVLEQKMQALEAEKAALLTKLDGYQNRLQKLEDPSKGLVLRSLRYGSVDGAREAFLSKENETSKRLREITQEMEQLHPMAARAGVPGAVNVPAMQDELTRMKQRVQDVQTSLQQPLGNETLSATDMAKIQRELNYILQDKAEPYGKRGSLDMDLKGVAEGAVVSGLDRKCKKEETMQLERFITSAVQTPILTQQMDALMKDMEAAGKQGFNPQTAADLAERFQNLSTELQQTELHAAAMNLPPVSRQQIAKDANAALAAENAQLEFESQAMDEARHLMKDIKAQAEGMEMRNSRPLAHEKLDPAAMAAIQAEAAKLLVEDPDTYGPPGSLDMDIQTLAAQAADTALDRDLTPGELNQVERALMKEHLHPVIKAEVKQLEKEVQGLSHKNFDSAKMATLAGKLEDMSLDVNVASARSRVLAQPPAPAQAVALANESLRNLKEDLKAEAIDDAKKAVLEFSKEGGKKGLDKPAAPDAADNSTGASYKSSRPKIAPADTTSSSIRTK